MPLRTYSAGLGEIKKKKKNSQHSFSVSSYEMRFIHFKRRKHARQSRVKDKTDDSKQNYLLKKNDGFDEFLTMTCSTGVKERIAVLNLKILNIY